jgi:hypothetical protein
MTAPVPKFRSQSRKAAFGTAPVGSAVPKSYRENSRFSELPVASPRVSRNQFRKPWGAAAPASRGGPHPRARDEMPLPDFDPSRDR